MRITTTDHALELLDSIRRAAQLRGDEAEAKLLEAVTAHITDRVVLRLEVERDLAALRAAATEVHLRAERQRAARLAVEHRGGTSGNGISLGPDEALRKLRPFLDDTQQ